jgi:hypothetical protein
VEFFGNQSCSREPPLRLPRRPSAYGHPAWRLSSDCDPVDPTCAAWAGGTLHYQVGPKQGNVQPYVGAGFGYARLTLDSTTDGRSQTNGLFVSPQAGLRVLFKAVELDTAVRYHHVYTGTSLNRVDDRLQRNFGGLGFGLGLFVRL